MTYFVHLAGSAIRFAVEPNETLLAAGLRQGLALPFGCQSGACGSCRARMLSGAIEPAPGAAATGVATLSAPAGVIEKDLRPPALALGAAETAAGYILLCQVHARTDIELQLHQPPGIERRRPRTLTGRVIEHRALAADVVQLSLQLPRGEPFEYLPGQYVDFLLPDGRRRSFSIANGDARDDRLHFHLRVTPGGRFAHYVRDEMPERTLLRFEGPLGAFYLRDDFARPVLLIAGGTGFAPIQAMLERALAQDARAPMHLFWGARSRRDLYLHDRVQAWCEQHADSFRYTPVLSEPDADWTGARGMVTEALLRDYPDPRRHAAYLAGPPAMVHAGKHALLAAGLDPDHLFYDSFDYAHETWPAAG